MLMMLIYVLRGRVYTVKKNEEALIFACMDTGLEVQGGSNMTGTDL